MTAAFYNVAKLLLQLERLGQDDMNDSDEADVIRDELDLYWNKLTEQERNIAGEIVGLLGELEETDEH